MSAGDGGRYGVPRGLRAALLRVLRDEARASEVAADLEELAQRRRPRLPALFYWRQVLALAIGLRLSSRGRVGAGASFSDLGLDLKQAWRGVRRRPGVATTVVLTLGLAIGFNAAVFAVLRAIVLEPLPFPEADRLVVIDEVTGDTGQREDLSGPNLLDFRRATTRLSALAGWRVGKLARTSLDGPPESLTAVFSTADLFRVLETPAMLGRTFLSGDEESRSVVVSAAYWTTALSEDVDAVGSTLVLDGVPHEILGVMPHGFTFAESEVSVWVPLPDRVFEGEPRGYRTWNAVGRLAPGARAAEAEAELDALVASLAADFPENEGWHASVRPAGEAYRDTGTLPLLLLGAVGLVLLIACVNAANVLFVRALDRSAEVSVRAALGASRGRLARFVLLEAAILAVAAGVVGVGLASGLVVLLERLDPGVMPEWNAIAVSWEVVAFTFGFSTLAALLAAAIPALHIVRRRVGGSLTELGGRLTGGRAERRLRDVLVTAEVALTLILLHGAGLVAWSLYSVSNVDPGFERANVLTATAVLRGSGAELIRQYDEIMPRLRAIPGVLSASTISALPMNPVGANYHADAFSVEFPERTPPSDRPEVEIRVVGPGYLETLGIPLLAGRAQTDADRSDQPMALMVNETLARRFFPEGDAVGRHLTFGPGSGMEVVGVVADVKHDGLDAEARPEVYLAFLQAPHNDVTFAIKTLGDPTRVARAVRDAVAEVAPEIPLVGVATMEAIVDGSMARRRFNVAIFASVGALAGLLALVGIYGVTSYAVSRRNREIGIRQAVGARRGDVFVGVVGHALALIVAGAGLGVVGALWTSRYVESQLFGIEAGSLVGLAWSAAALLLIGLVGCLVPAVRATRIDPLTALRME